MWNFEKGGLTLNSRSVDFHDKRKKNQSNSLVLNRFCSACWGHLIVTFFLTPLPEMSLEVKAFVFSHCLFGLQRCSAVSVVPHFWPHPCFQKQEKVLPERRKADRTDYAGDCRGLCWAGSPWTEYLFAIWDTAHMENYRKHSYGINF